MMGDLQCARNCASLFAHWSTQKSSLSIPRGDFYLEQFVHKLLWTIMTLASHKIKLIWRKRQASGWVVVTLQQLVEGRQIFYC